MKVSILSNGSQFLIGANDLFLNENGQLLQTLPEGFEPVKGFWTSDLKDLKSMSAYPCRRNGTYGFSCLGEGPPDTEWYILSMSVGYHLHTCNSGERVFYWTGSEWTHGKGTRTLADVAVYVHVRGLL